MPGGKEKRWSRRLVRPLSVISSSTFQSLVFNHAHSHSLLDRPERMDPMDRLERTERTERPKSMVGQAPIVNINWGDYTPELNLDLGFDLEGDNGTDKEKYHPENCSGNPQPENDTKKLNETINDRHEYPVTDNVQRADSTYALSLSDYQTPVPSPQLPLEKWHSKGNSVHTIYSYSPSLDSSAPTACTVSPQPSQDHLRHQPSFSTGVVFIGEGHLNNDIFEDDCIDWSRLEKDSIDLDGLRLTLPRLA
uniref:ARAD1A05236p n=1 Tax=Blastobotrys adeninivorans TaxID=409370 RepID=A0A060T256_BLAAD